MVAMCTPRDGMIAHSDHVFFLDTRSRAPPRAGGTGAAASAVGPGPAPNARPAGRIAAGRPEDGQSVDCRHQIRVRSVRKGIGVTSASALFEPGRLVRARDAIAGSDLGALFLTPGPDLRYVTGYDAKQ